VTVAASVVHSADRAGLTTRFVTTDGADIRGPEVASQTLHLLARIDPSYGPTVPVERDPGEGLGLVVAITTGRHSSTWAALERVAEPALTTLGVFTMESPRRAATLAIDARTEASFLDGWALMAGVTRLDASRPPRPNPSLVDAV
jgi:hypothetical protein